VIYDRFSRGSERGLWGKILFSLQEEGIVINEVIHRQYDEESPPAWGWTKRGQQTKGKVELG
jgi:hypothetical protein